VSCFITYPFLHIGMLGICFFFLCFFFFFGPVVLVMPKPHYSPEPDQMLSFAVILGVQNKKNPPPDFASKAHLSVPLRLPPPNLDAPSLFFFCYRPFPLSFHFFLFFPLARGVVVIAFRAFYTAFYYDLIFFSQRPPPPNEIFLLWNLLCRVVFFFAQDLFNFSCDPLYSACCPSHDGLCAPAMIGAILFSPTFSFSGE